jgi:hypothetical protein
MVGSDFHCEAKKKTQQLEAKRHSKKYANFLKTRHGGRKMVEEANQANPLMDG